MRRNTALQREMTLALTKSGFTAPEIASGLGITERTVRRFREEARNRGAEVSADCRSLESALSDGD